MGLGHTAIRYLASEVGPAFVDTARFLLTASLLLSVSAAVLLLLLQPLMVAIWPAEAFQALWPYSLPLASLQVFLAMGQSILVAERRFSAMALSVGSAEIIRLGLTAALILAGGPIDGLFIGAIAAFLVSDLAVAVLLRRYLKPRLHHPRQREMLQFGGLLQAASVVTMIGRRVIEGFLAAHLGPAALAVYAAAMQIPRQIDRAFNSQRPVILGLVSSVSGNDRDISLRLFRFMGGLTAVAAAIMIAGAEPMIILFYTASYLDSVPIFQILASWTSVHILNEIMIVLLMGKRKSRSLFWISIVNFLLMVAFGYLLISNFLGFGGALALFLPDSACLVLFMFIFSDRKLSVFWNYLAVCGKVYAVLAAAGCFFLFFAPSFWISVLAAALAVTVAFASRLLTLSDVNLLAGHLRSAARPRSSPRTVSNPSPLT
jgi:O-antigen/teichoic acid export membrane protein